MSESDKTKDGMPPVTYEDVSEEFAARRREGNEMARVALRDNYIRAALSGLLASQAFACDLEQAAGLTRGDGERTRRAAIVGRVADLAVLIGDAALRSAGRDGSSS